MTRRSLNHLPHHTMLVGKIRFIPQNCHWKEPFHLIPQRNIYFFHTNGMHPRIVQFHLAENFHRFYHTNGKRSLSCVLFTFHIISSMLPPADSSTRPSSSDKATVTWYVQIVYVIIIIVLAFLGNILIFVVICVDRRLHKIDNIFIANLAVSDFLFTLIETCSNTTREIKRNWRPPHEFTCYIIIASSVLCASASVFTQTAVAINRYLAVIRPLKYPTIVNERRVFISVAVIWTCAIALASPPLIWRPLTVICGEEESYERHVTYEIVYMTAEWILIFVIPFGIMSLIYFRIYQIARGHAQQVRPSIYEDSTTTSNENPTNSGSTSKTVKHITNFRKEFKAAKMLVTIAGAFLISWLPFFVTLTMWKFNDGAWIHPKVFTSFLYLVYAVPAINPAIYAFWCRDIRRGIKQLLTCCKQDRLRQEQRTSAVYIR